MQKVSGIFLSETPKWSLTLIIFWIVGKDSEQLPGSKSRI